MSNQVVNFVFRNNGTRFDLTDARLGDGTAIRAQKAVSGIHEILEKQKAGVSGLQELNVTLIQQNEAEFSLLICSTDHRFSTIIEKLDVDTLDHFAGDILSSLKTREAMNTFLKDLKGKNPDAQSLELLTGQINELLSSEDPSALLILNHILNQKAAMSPSALQKLCKEVKAGLLNIQMQELGRKREHLEDELIDAKAALNTRQKFKLGDLVGFIGELPDLQLEQTLLKNTEQLKKQEKELARAEELVPQAKPRSAAELKVIIPKFIHEYAGHACFPELLDLWKSVQDMTELLKQAATASWLKRPLILAKLYTYGDPVKKGMESLEDKLPYEKQLKFRVLFGEFAMSPFGEVAEISQSDEFIESYLSNTSAALPELLPTIIRKKNEIKISQNEIDKAATLLKVSKNRKELERATDPSEIQKLENTEYEISGNTLKKYQNLKVAETHQVCQTLMAMDLKVRANEMEFQSVTEKYYAMSREIEGMLKT